MSIKDELRNPAKFVDGVSDEDHIRGVGRALGRTEEEIEEGLKLRRKNWAYYELALSHRDIYESGEEIKVDASYEKPDYEFEVAALLEKSIDSGLNTEEAEAFLREHAQVTVLNDLSCRGLQGVDIQMKLGPARSKTLLGKCLGPDFMAFSAFRDRNPTLTLRVNGDVRMQRPAYTDVTIWPLSRIVSYFSKQDLILDAGTLVGSGTFGGGSIAETDGEYPWLTEESSPETVEMEVEGIGTLKNTFVRK